MAKKVVKKARSKMAKLADSVTLIMQAFNTIPAKFNAKRNPHTGQKLITNIPTQILADRPHSFVVTFLVSGKKKVITRESYMPVGSMETRNQAKRRYTAYRLGKFSSKVVAEKEIWSLLSYFIVCVCKGKLPTPDKRSGASTIRSEFIAHWLKGLNAKVESIKILGSEGSELTHSENYFNSIMQVYQDNAHDILMNWQDSVRAVDTDFVI